MSTYPKSPKEMTSGIMYFPRMLDKIGALYSLGMRHWPASIDAMGRAFNSHDLKRITWLRRDFSPARYVLHCEMPLTTDAQSSKQEMTHADLEMVREIEIQ